MATWPASLPSPRIDGYSINPADQVIRTEMDAGNTRARRRTTSRKDIFPVAWVLDQTDMATFRAWFDDSSTGANGGQAWFAMGLLTGDSASKQTVTCRFSGPWKADYLGKGFWSVTAQLEVRYA